MALPQSWAAVTEFIATQEAKTVREAPPSFLLEEPRKEPGQQPPLESGKKIPEGESQRSKSPNSMNENFLKRLRMTLLPCICGTDLKHYSNGLKN